MLFTVSQAGSSTGRTVGAIAGHNLASYTAELGGKVRNLPVADLRFH